ncbi:membrane-associated phospholipid phosphatase [Arthrobacter sp. V4I6]|uniref:phosphatase PAP2 family protein n=1 Tax=unclassified Arthrobacter TaxID=235627 RepID=UPI0027884E0F|nr:MULTISPECIES: phosphatase PAP2 family protein [unclassified Arthrobacter]MDQ0819804.1 membrane-associated phospholipid phosphatase [Arthrobacter sp. V1I7]MDQ0853983.1 membrane-associated phospholipid phosphatase [Arthrobacter sp. V4I6]
MDFRQERTDQHAPSGYPGPQYNPARKRRAAAESPGGKPGKGLGLTFTLATLACLAALAATYFFFVRTATGQFIDESALVEAVEIHGTAGKAANKLLDWLPAASVLIATVVILLVTILRRRWSAAGIAVAACVGANVATQILKDLVPVRPYRGIETLEFNSLPSGHTTLAASAAAAVFLVVSPRWRPLVGFLGGSFAVATGVSTLINQWHRPADVVAAFLVVAAFMLPAGWLIIRTGPRWNAWTGYGEHWAASRLWLALPMLAGLASASLAGYSLLKIAPGPGQEGSTSDYFWAGTTLIVIVGYLATVAGVWLFGQAARRRRAPRR